jgi:hypothetical protein
MIEIGSIKVLGDVFKQAFDIKKGLQKAVEEDFDKRLIFIFSDLNTSAKAYIVLISDLLLGLNNSADVKEFKAALQKAYAQRANMVMDRNRILASVDYVKSILLTKNPELTSDPFLQTARASDVEKNLINFCAAVRYFFFKVERNLEIYGEPEDETSTRCTGVFQRIEWMLSMVDENTDLEIDQLKEAAALEIKEMLQTQERAWTITCRFWEFIKGQKKEVLRALEI